MNDVETVVSISESRSEWYDRVLWCKKCGLNFMVDLIDGITSTSIQGLYCPKCGRKIIGADMNNETVYNFKEEISLSNTLQKDYDDGYQEGLNDAWNCAGKIVCDCNYPNNHLRQYVTNGDTLVKFFIDTSASEAIAKVNEYELKRKGANIC